MPVQTLLALETSAAFASEDASAAEKWVEQCAQHAFLMERLKAPTSCLTPRFDRSKTFHRKKEESSFRSSELAEPNAEASRDLKHLVVEDIRVQDRHSKLLNGDFDRSRNKLIQVLKILRLNRKDKGTQLKGLNYMYSSGRYDDLIHMGAGKILVDALKNYPNDDQIQALACRMMSICSHELTPGVESFERNAETLIKFGAGQQVLNSLANNMGKRAVQLNALYALYNMSFFNVEIRKALATGGVLANQIVVTMNNHNDRDIQVECCAVISKFAFESLNFFIKAGAIEAIVDAMENHHESDELMELACEALKDIFECSSFEYRGIMGQKLVNTLVKFIQSQLQLEHDSYNILKQLVSVVARLSTHIENRPIFIAAKLDELVMDSFNKAFQDPGTVCWIMYSLNLLTYYNAQEAKKLKQLNAIKLVKSSLKEHKDPSVQKQARVLLNFLKKNGKPIRK